MNLSSQLFCAGSTFATINDGLAFRHPINMRSLQQRSPVKASLPLTSLPAQTPIDSVSNSYELRFAFRSHVWSQLWRSDITFLISKVTRTAIGGTK